MLEVWAVFDSTDAVLHQELKNVKLALPSANSEERARLLALRNTIQQELDERSSSQSLLQQLLPIVQGSTPDTFADDAPALLAAAANAPSALQKDLLELVQAGQRIAHLRSAPPPAPQAHASPVHGEPGAAGPVATAAHVSPAPQQRTAWGSPGDEHQRTQQLQPAQKVSGHGAHSPTSIASGGGSPGRGGGGGSLPASAHPRTQPSRPLITPVGRPHSANALSPLPPESSQQSEVSAYTMQQGVTAGMSTEAEVVVDEELDATQQWQLDGRGEAQDDGQAPAAAPSELAEEAEVDGTDSKKKRRRKKKKKGEEEEGPPRPQMTVLEAALAAFQEEQRKLHKARKAITKGPPRPAAAGPVGQITRSELVAMYRGPPPTQPASNRLVPLPGPAHNAPIQLQQQVLADESADSEGSVATQSRVPNIVLYPPPQPPEVAPATGTLSSRSSAAASIAEEDVGTAGTGAAVSHASQGVLNKGEVSSNMGAKAAGGMLASTQVPPHLHQASEGSSSSYETDTDDTGSYVTEEEKEDEGQEHRGTDTAKPVLGGMQPSQPHTVRRPESLSLGGAGPHAAQGPGSQARGGAQVPGRPISAAAGAQSGPQDKEAAIAAYLQRPEFQVVPIELSLRGAHAMESVRVVGDSQGEEAQQGTGVGGRVDRWSDWDMGDNQGVSAWGRDAEDDPLASALRDMRSVPRAPSHVPPQSLPGRRPPAAPSPSPLPSQAAGYGSLLQAASVEASSIGQPSSQQQVQDKVQASASPRSRPASATQPTQQPAQDLPQAGTTGGGVFTTITSSKRQLVTQAVAAGAGVAQDPAKPAEPVSAGGAASAALPGSSGSQESGSSQHVHSTTAGVMTVARRPSSASPSLSRPPPPQPVIPGAVYAQHFSVFHDVLTICYSGGPGALIEQAVLSAAGTPGSGLGTGALARPSSRGLAHFSAGDVIDKLQGLGLRLAAWHQELDRRQQQQQQAGLRRSLINTEAPSPWVRYYACADDTAHPEVRQVLALALGPESGAPEAVSTPSLAWALDPADQITEPAQPDSDDDTQDPPMVQVMGNSQATAAQQQQQQQQQQAGPASQYSQARSPLVGRCNMWNLLWSWSLKARAPLSDLLVWQRVNHFPEAKQLTRKDLLKKHLVRYQVMHGSHVRLGHLFSCLPTTFVLPKEMDAATDAFQRAVHGVEPSVTQPKGLNLWMSKPVGKSRGRGIRLIRSLRELTTGPGGAGSLEEPIVLQRYVTNPLAVQGYKFDLRLYVLVTSFNPLEAWICTEGFARFATVPFTLDEEQLGNKFVHLTNSSVQKSRAAKGELPPFLAHAEPQGGSKLSLTQLRSLLAEQKVEWSVVWSRITEVVTACLFAAQDAIPPCVNAFELFGFDVLIDTSGSVWVLEVNSSPSLSLDTPLDRAIKPRMLRDAIAIVDPLPFDRAALAEVVSARSSAKGRRGATRAAGGVGGRVDSERDLMCADLQAILGGRVPRKYGEPPAALLSPGGGEGNWFHCIAPSPLLEKLTKLRGRGGRGG